MSPKQPAARVRVPNPFAPIFGKRPPLVVGRQTEVAGFGDALAEGPGAAGRVAAFSGPHGVGKTTLLREIEAEALARGWMVISADAGRDLIEDLTGRLLQLPKRRPRHPTRLEASPMPGGDDMSSARGLAEARAAYVPVAQLALGQLRSWGSGLLITVDDLATTSDVAALGVVLEVASQPDADLAVVAAGLPSPLDGPVRPAWARLTGVVHVALQHVASAEARAALEVPIREGGRRIKDDDLARAAAATSGYPLMIQLIGHGIWRQRPTHVRIATEDVTAGIKAARRRLEQLVFEPALRDLSGLDRAFLVAMSADDGPSRVAAVGARMGVDPKLAGQYRLRLLRRRVIVAAGHGAVDFELPLLREYVRAHIATPPGSAVIERRAS